MGIADLTDEEWHRQAREWMAQNERAAGVLPRFAVDPDIPVEEEKPLAREKREYDPLFQTVGRVGRDPETKTGQKGDFVVFTLAVDESYDDDAAPIWYDVSVFNEGLQATVLRDIYKGAKVAIEGNLTYREYQGKEYPRISAFKVGLVEWLRKEQTAGSRRPERSRPQPARRPAGRPAPRTEEVDDSNGADNGADFPF